MKDWNIFLLLLLLLFLFWARGFYLQKDVFVFSGVFSCLRDKNDKAGPGMTVEEWS